MIFDKVKKAEARSKKMGLSCRKEQARALIPLPLTCARKRKGQVFCQRTEDFGL
jgi:hypothetical protein